MSKSVAELELSPGSPDSHPLLGDWRLEPHRAVWPGGGYGRVPALWVPRTSCMSGRLRLRSPQDISAWGALCWGRQPGSRLPGGLVPFLRLTLRCGPLRAAGGPSCLWQEAPIRRFTLSSPELMSVCCGGALVAKSCLTL